LTIKLTPFTESVFVTTWQTLSCPPFVS
jgi:hypothetical protein